MPVFLNTEKFNFWLKELILKSEEELILIVPYIKVSEEIFSCLQKANSRGVEILIIYRESKVTEKEKEKLLSLQNLNLFYHPNIHCKCYFNGDALILGSMNLYEYSVENNREMGVLLLENYDSLWDKKYSIEEYDEDNEEFFEDTVKEIREIINGSAIEHLTNRSKENNLDFYIVKTPEEKAWSFCNYVNLHFINKRFKVVFENEEWTIKGTNFYDKVDVYFDVHRVRIKINKPFKQLQTINKRWKDSHGEYSLRGFKQYWNNAHQDIYLYPNKKFKFWNDPDLYIEKEIQAYAKGINKIIHHYKELIK